MALDIKAFRGLRPAEGFTVADGEVYHPDGSYAGGEAVHFYLDGGSRAPELSAGVVYTSAGCFGFRAGSYGGYNAWRNQLAILAGWASAEKAWDEAGRIMDADARPDSPFWELINFSDCEGVIGAAVSAKLAKDFTEWQERAEKYAATLPSDDAGWFMAKYADWRKAFEMAADGGAVEFH